MTACTDSRDTSYGGPLPARVTLPIAANTRIFKGSLVGENSSGQAIPATVLATCVRVFGKASATYDNRTGSDLGGLAGACDVEIETGEYNWANSGGGDAIAADDIGKLCYAVDDQTVALTSNGGTRPIAGLITDFRAAKSGGSAVPWVFSSPLVPVFYDTLTILASTATGEGAALIGIEDAANNFAATTVEAALAEIIADYAAVTATNGASKIGVQDSANLTTAANVETVLAELLQTECSVQKQVNIPLNDFVDADGDPIVKFVNGGADGFQLGDLKTRPYRVNNAANPPAIMVSVPMPQDMDDTADVVIHALVSKSGATLADAMSITYACYFQTVAALHDADADCGGISSAVAGDAVAKTVTEITRTIAAADVPAAPCSLTIIAAVTPGTLGTDDGFIHSMWLEYKGKKLTS